MVSPIITIFVRHKQGCKYAGDEFHKACRCRKHLRWSKDGKQFRKQAGTRSWSEAEEVKRTLEAELSGKPIPGADKPAVSMEEAIRVFIADKKNQGVSSGVEGKYERELKRFQVFCENHAVFTVRNISRELLIGYAATWEDLYPSTATRFNVQARLKYFLNFCFESQWIDRVPKMSRIKIDEAPTLPLPAKEYERLLKTAPKSFSDPVKAKRVRGLVQAMRWTGLAIRDTVVLRRDAISFDKVHKCHLVTTSRQKTGTDVSVPIPPKVAAEILKVPNGNPEYVFWHTGTGKETSAVTNWQHDLRKLFKDAKVRSEGNMLSHRLRDTFAVDLLQKGVPMEEVSKLLGHESIKTTERHYAKWVKGRQDRLNTLVMGTWD
jgi:integrase/recombinase XerD